MTNFPHAGCARLPARHTSPQPASVRHRPPLASAPSLTPTHTPPNRTIPDKLHERLPDHRVGQGRTCGQHSGVGGIRAAVCHSVTKNAQGDAMYRVSAQHTHWRCGQFETRAETKACVSMRHWAVDRGDARRRQGAVRRLPGRGAADCNAWGLPPGAEEAAARGAGSGNRHSCRSRASRTARLHPRAHRLRPRCRSNPHRASHPSASRTARLHSCASRTARLHPRASRTARLHPRASRTARLHPRSQPPRPSLPSCPPAQPAYPIQSWPRLPSAS